MSLLTLFGLNLFRRPLVVKPEHAFEAPPRIRDFSSTETRTRAFAAPGRETDFASTVTRTRTFTAPARVRDFTAGS